MNFKDLQKELPVLLGWKIHCLEKVHLRISFEDLRTYDECHEEIYLAYAPLGGYNLLLFIWGDNEDLIVKKMNEELGSLLKGNSLLIDSVTLLYSEEILGYVERLQEVYDRRNK